MSDIGAISNVPGGDRTGKHASRLFPGCPSPQDSVAGSQDPLRRPRPGYRKIKGVHQRVLAASIRPEERPEPLPSIIGIWAGHKDLANGHGPSGWGVAGAIAVLQGYQLGDWVFLDEQTRRRALTTCQSRTSS